MVHARLTFRTGLVFLAFALPTCVLSQTIANPPDYSVYLSFFREAAQQSGGTHTSADGAPVTLNGQADVLIRPSIEDTLGITEREARSLVETSGACERAIDSLDADARALIFESRLRAANEDGPSEALTRRLEELAVKRNQVILDYVNRLEISLGADRFKRIDQYVRLHANSGSFFPAAAARKL